jgi:hypothetical protein
MSQFKMGMATTPLEVIQALDNFEIILQDLTTLHAMVTVLEDDARTLSARKTDPAALPIMRSCTPPPTDQELFHLLRETIQPTASNGIIMGTFHTLRHSTFQELKVILKQTAEQCITYPAPSANHSAHQASVQQKSGEADSPTPELATTLGKRGWEGPDTFAGGFAAATALQKSLQQPVQQQWPSWNPGYYGPTTVPMCNQPWDDSLQLCEYAKRNGYCKFTHQHQGHPGGPQGSRAIPVEPPRSISFTPANSWPQQGQQHRSLNFAPATFLPPLRMPSPSPAPAAGTSPGRRPATPF